jgi:hypothetical protein
MSAAAQPLTEVKVMKMKECLMVTMGWITLLIMQSWTLACRCYKKHSGKTDTEIVSYVMEGMFEPCLVMWYQADQTCIDGLTLDEYLLELSQLVLEKIWAHDILETILSSSQGLCVFIDWKIKIENLNPILATSTPSQALTRDQLKVQLQLNLHPNLRLSLSLKLVLATNLATWTFVVKDQDDRMHTEDAHTQKLIDTSMATRTVKRKTSSHIYLIHWQRVHPHPPPNQRNLLEHASLPSWSSSGTLSRNMRVAHGAADSMLDTAGRNA